MLTEQLHKNNKKVIVFTSQFAGNFANTLQNSVEK